MVKIERILAATDGGEHGFRAVATGGALARRAGAAFEVVTVAEPIIVPEAQTPAGVQVAEYEDAFLDEARNRAGAQVREVGMEDAPLHVRSGLAARVIAELGDELEADLIAVGAHPKPALARFLVGSTEERVIRLAERPVLVAVEPRRDPFRRVLAGVDLSEHSVRVLRAAAAVAATDGAAFRALYVQEPLPPMLEESETLDVAEHRGRGRAQLETLLKRADLPEGLEIQIHVHEGKAGDRILEEAQEWDADLIVMGTHGFGFFERLLLGSTSLHVLRHGHRATVVVPPRKEKPKQE